MKILRKIKSHANKIFACLSLFSMLANTLAPLAAVVPSHVYAEGTGASEEEIVVENKEESASGEEADTEETADGQDLTVEEDKNEDEKTKEDDVEASDTGENKVEENGNEIESENPDEDEDVVDPEAPDIIKGGGVSDYRSVADIEDNETVEVGEIPMPVKVATTESSGTEPATVPSGTEPITTIEISETEPSPVVDPEVSVIEEPVGTLEVKKYETLAEDMEVEDSTEEYWNVDGEVAKTINKVKLGVKYIFPLDKEVSVTFTKLPELEEDRDYLKIERVKVDDLNLPDDFKTNAEYAFDITTFNEDRDEPMKNGEDFEYDLTLPRPEGADIEVKYTEDGNTYESVDNNIEVKIEVKSNVVSIEGLDHFSTYCVGNRVLSANPVPIEAEIIPTWCDITISKGQSIQEAINGSSVEKPLTICIRPGEYEENLTIKNPVKLVALLNDSSKEGVVIVGANTEPTIHILDTKNVTIDGFTFQGTNGSYGAIHIENSNNCTIQNNVFLKNSLDIFTDHGSQHTITNNKFNGGEGDNRLAIKGNSTKSSLMNNAFSNYSTAIAIGEEHKIYNNQFVNNTIQIETGTNTEIIEDYLSKNTFDRAVVVRNNPITVGKIFSRIQDAIDASEGGNTIQVLSGTYKEIVNINKSLSLVGVKENPPTILGRFEINTSGKVNIKNMNFQVPVPVANPVGNSADSININKVGELYVDNCNFNGSELFLNGGRGIISNDSQSNVTVENSTFSNGYYTAIQGKYKELNIKDTTISNCKSGINFQGGNNLTITNTNISVVAKGNSNDTYAVRFASESANTGKDMILNGGKYVVDKKGFTADPGIYHSAIIVRSGASGVLKANNLSLGGEVVNLSGVKLDATKNWWGNLSGPYNSTTNPLGTGNPVSDNVDFCPWFYTDNTTETGELFGPCIDDEKPVIESVTYSKNSTSITEQGTATHPVYVKSVTDLSYNISFSDDLKLGKHVFVIYQENPEIPGTPYWVGNGGTAYCSFTGTTNTFALEGKNDSLSNVSFNNCATGLPEGRYVVVNRVYDAVGKFSESYDLTFVVDNTPPAKPTGLHRKNRLGETFACGGTAQRQAMIPDWDDITNDPSFSHFEYSSFNADGSQGKDEMILYTSKFESGWVAPVDGTYGYTVRSVDKAGNKSAWAYEGETLEDSCKITYDSTPPTLEITSPNNGGIYNTDVTLSGKVTDANPHHYWLEITKDGKNLNIPDVTGEQSATTFSTTLTEDGEYHVTFAARDAAGGTNRSGNRSGDITITFTIDKTKPVITLGAYTTNWTNEDIIVNASTNEGTLNYNSHTFTENGSFDFIATDKAGNITTKTVTITNIDKNVPTSAITTYNLKDGDSVITNSWDGKIAGTASDSSSGVKEVKVSIQRGSDSKYWDGSTWQESETSVTAGGTTDWTYQIDTTLTDGTYTIKSHATDNAGNTENSYTITIVLDKTIPEVSIFLDPENPDGSNGWYKNKPEITLTATDTNSSDKVEYQWGSDTGSWTVYTSPFKPDSEGKLVLYYRSIDKAGNESVGVKNIKVDTDKPSSVSNVKATYNENENSITLDWDVEDSDIEEVRVYKGESSDFDTDSLNRISKQSADDENYTDKGDLDISISRGNTYHYKLVAIDSAGNRSNTKKVSIEIPEEGGAPVVAVEEGVVEGAGAGEEEEGQVAGEETGPEGEGVVKGTENEEGSVLGEETAKASGEQSIFKSFWFWLILVVLGVLIIWLINKKSENGTKTKKKYM